jgi:hypothetical protein
MVCLDRCESVDGAALPENLFDGCDMFQLRANEYLRKWDDGRRQLNRTDMIVEEVMLNMSYYCKYTFW